jgi:hypothetical protein
MISRRKNTACRDYNHTEKPVVKKTNPAVPADHGWTEYEGLR